MDSRPATAESKQLYQSAGPWNRISSSATPRSVSSSATTPLSDHPSSATSPFPATFDLLPILVSQHQEQLLQYNKLVAPGRGGGGLQTSPSPITLAVPSLQAAPRPRSLSKVSNKDAHSNKQAPAASQSCHGNRAPRNPDKTDRAVMTKGKDKEAPSKMPPKQAELSHPLPSRPAQRAAQQSAPPTQSNSVPSTPHQHARKFSFESREPSPTAAQNHSPRSAYSETNGNVPSLRPLPPRLAGCRFETAFVAGRRRMPYSLGTDRLEKTDLDKIKSRLSEDEESKLTTDMRELYARLLPTDKVEENRKRLVHKLEKIFNDEWPGHDIRVHLFGSSGNLLCSDDSDVDICITTNWKEMENVCLIADLLSHRGMEKVVCVASAKVPIVKIWDPELKLACDMNVNNTMALENTRMVRTYVQIDDRVRPLAMVVKYWTRKRVVNDAAFGGTLSSYTWICLIIAFLQLRDPPVLPALHQCPHLKLPTANGHKTDFADDLSKLKGFGSQNKSSLGQLLFEFFRFYAHEFDYETKGLSVRLGKMIQKTEKRWHLAQNNSLCVEEPWNTNRNLGNTADDFSFRGLHLELRRAFDLISEAKLNECCEQFVFPKEEPTEQRIFQKPVARPAIIRSSSQQHSGRGGGRNGNYRGNRHPRNGGNNRRASSSNAYDSAANAAFAQPGILPTMTISPQDPQWYSASHYPYSGDLFGKLSALQIQEHQLWYHLYTQSQLSAQQQAIAHAQRMHGASNSTDRSRTNSFDQPPLTAPLRPEWYQYGVQLQPTLYHAQAGFTTYPNSPSTTTAAPEFRRSLHRSTVANDSGSSSGSGTLRSQSQPASRTSAPNGQNTPTYIGSSHALHGVSNFVSRQVNGVPIPSFIPDESNDSEYDEGSNRTASDSPPAEDGAGYLGYYVTNDPSPARRSTNGVPSFGDMGQNNGKDSAPVIVNGSAFAPASATLPTRPAAPPIESRLADDVAFNNPLRISQGQAVAGLPSEPLSARSAMSIEPSTHYSERPVVVNGSTHAGPTSQAAQNLQSFNQRLAAAHASGSFVYPVPFGDGFQGRTQVPDAGRARVLRYNQNGIAPLDLAIADSSISEAQHLSPVYETRTPSPTVLRRFEAPVSYGGVVPPMSTVESRAEGPVKSQQKSSVAGNDSEKENHSVGLPHHRLNVAASRDQESARSAKDEADNFGGWQKPRSRKKQADSKATANGYPQSEKMPMNESDRKGG